MLYGVENKIAILTSKMKRRRKQLGLTQAEVAKRCGLKQSNYSRMESGRQTPNLETLLTIFDCLRLSLEIGDDAYTTYHVMHEDDPVADVILSRDKKEISFVKYMPDGWQQPFSGNKLDLERFYRFVKSRCYEDGRADLDIILSLTNYWLTQ